MVVISILHYIKLYSHFVEVIVIHGCEKSFGTGNTIIPIRASEARDRKK
jgi:hypothetical protein